MITPKDTSKFQKFAVVAKTIAILFLSLVLFPVGAFVFRSLVNRMAFHKEEFTDIRGTVFKGTMKFGYFYQGTMTLSNGKQFKGQCRAGQQGTQ